MSLTTAEDSCRQFVFYILTGNIILGITALIFVSDNGDQKTNETKALSNLNTLVVLHRFHLIHRFLLHIYHLKSSSNFKIKAYLCAVARVLAIDYGTKRTGIAATDPLKLIASPLETVSTAILFDYLANYLAKEEVETIVVGEPLYPDGNPSQIHHLVIGFVRKLRKLHPNLTIELHDESFTSEEAKKVILRSGAKKKKRRDKSLVDQVSASLILTDYLESKRYW